MESNQYYLCHVMHTVIALLIGEPIDHAENNETTLFDLTIVLYIVEMESYTPQTGQNFPVL